MPFFSDVFLHINFSNAEHNIRKLLVRNLTAIIFVNSTVNVSNLIRVHMDLALKHALGKLLKVQLAVTVFVVHLKSVDDLSCGPRLSKFTDYSVETLAEGISFTLDRCCLHLLLLNFEHAFFFFLLGLFALLLLLLVLTGSSWLLSRFCGSNGLRLEDVLLTEFIKLFLLRFGALLRFFFKSSGFFLGFVLLLVLGLLVSSNRPLNDYLREDTCDTGVLTVCHTVQDL